MITECLDRLGADVPAYPSKGVWFSRTGDTRTLANEPEVAETLAREGWLVIPPGALSLMQQIAIAKGTPRIAGVNGAGLTNLVFAAPGTSITAFMPALMPDVFFWMLAGFKRQPYVEVRCRQDLDPKSPTGWNALLRLPTADVLGHLGL